MCRCPPLELTFHPPPLPSPSWLCAATRLLHPPLMRGARLTTPTARPFARPPVSTRAPPPALTMAGKRAASGDPLARPPAAAAGPAAGEAAPPTDDDLLAGITPRPLPPPLAAWVDALPGDVRHVLDAITAAGGAAWPVGGCVRDVMAGRPPREVDVCTSLPPSAVAAVFPDAVPHRGTGDTYGTLSVRRGGTVLEVTTLRMEGSYTDGRRPDAVTIATRLVDDLARRDFTVNAAAVDVTRRLLLDPHGGADDAAAGLLRCVGDPATRLTDDGLRVWRAYRFLDAGAAGLRTLDPPLATALASAPVQAAAARVSRERVWEELSKILVGRNADAVLRAMAVDGALAAAVPGTLDASPTARGVRVQAHLLTAWRRFHERARAHGLNVHSGSVAAGRAASPSSSPRAAGAPPPPAPPRPAMLLALDLEATCDAPRSPQPQEVIEIGAVLMDGETCTETARFHTHVRPTLHPILPDFCVAFTGVTQADVDAAPTLGPALDALTAWLVDNGALSSTTTTTADPHRLLPVTVGDWDLDTLLLRQAEAVGIELPSWAAAWCDAQVLYREHYLRPRASLASMLADLGLTHSGRPHAALDDAASLGVLLTAMARDGAVAEVTRSADSSVQAYAGDAPDLVVARLALLLAGCAPDAAASAARGLRLGRHEARRLTRAVASLGRLPDAADAAAARLFRCTMGSQLTLQLLLEATLAAADGEEAGGEEGGKIATARVDAFVDAWRALPPLSAPACLLDGASLMEATGLKPGQQLGRLKEWVWRVQVERDLASVADMRALLDELPWRGTDPKAWPRMEW